MSVIYYSSSRCQERCNRGIVGAVGYDTNHLLRTGECDADVLDILGVLKKMSSGLKKVVLEQIKVLASVC